MLGIAFFGGYLPKCYEKKTKKQEKDKDIHKQVIDY